MAELDVAKARLQADGMRNKEDYLLILQKIVASKEEEVKQKMAEEIEKERKRCQKDESARSLWREKMLQDTAFHVIIM